MTEEHVPVKEIARLKTQGKDTLAILRYYIANGFDNLSLQRILYYLDH